MNIMIVKTKKSKLIPILITFILIMTSISIGGYFYFNKTVIEPIEKKKKEKIMSNITFEINKIKNIVNANDIISINFEDNNIFIKVKKTANIEPIISRYENMLKVTYKNDFILLDIRKKEIKEDDSKKEQLYDYLLNKDVLINNTIRPDLNISEK